MQKEIAETLEQNLGAFTDFVCSHLIKQPLPNNANGVVLVKGGKAINAYLYLRDNIPSYDWDVTYYGAQDDCAQICQAYADEANHIFNAYMPTARAVIIKTINAYYDFSKARDDIYFTTSYRESRISMGVYIYSVILHVMHVDLAIIEMTYTPTTYDDLMISKNAIACAIRMPAWVLDGSRRFASLHYLYSDLQDLIALHSRYPKKEKAYQRYLRLDNAMKTCNFSPTVLLPPECDQRLKRWSIYSIVAEPEFDSTLIKLTNIPTTTTFNTLMLLVNQQIDYSPIYNYTANSRINNKLLRLAFWGGLDAHASLTNALNYMDEHDFEQLMKMDAAFDQLSRIYNCTFSNPVQVFRFVKYIDPPAFLDGNVSFDMYKLTPGMIIPCLHPISTSYDNYFTGNYTFNKEPQFICALMVISLKSMVGAIKIDTMSAYAGEKEVLLDRRGHLVVTDVVTECVSEQCGQFQMQVERLVYYMDYVPPNLSTQNAAFAPQYSESTISILGHNNRNFSTFGGGDEKIMFFPHFDAMESHDAETGISFFGDSVTKHGDLPVYARESAAGVCCEINMLRQINFHFKNDTGLMDINTADGVLSVPQSMIKESQRGGYELTGEYSPPQKISTARFMRAQPQAIIVGSDEQKELCAIL